MHNFFDQNFLMTHLRQGVCGRSQRKKKSLSQFHENKREKNTKKAYDIFEGFSTLFTSAA